MKVRLKIIDVCRCILFDDVYYLCSKYGLSLKQAHKVLDKLKRGDWVVR